MRYGASLACKLTACLGALAFAVSCVQAAALERLTGSVRYLERSALPADAMLTVELLEVSEPGGQTERLSRLALPTRGRQVPLAFELPFYPTAPKPNHRYMVRATLINRGGEVLFASTAAVPVRDHRDPIELIVQRMRDAPAAAALENTYWKLIEVNGVPARVQPGEREAYLLLLAGRATGSSGCNKLMGAYALAGSNTLTVGPLASTRMACVPDVATQESALIDAYLNTSGYRIDGESLLLLGGDAVLARFSVRAYK